MQEELITRKEAVRFYSSRANDLNWKLSEQVIERLPPALCHWLLEGGAQPSALTKCNRPEDYAVGFPTHQLQKVGSVFLSVDGLTPSIQTALPLDGHRPVAAPGILRWIHLALAELSEFAPSAMNTIQDWCSLIVWVERSPERTDVTELTSTSLPKLPFASFVSKK